MVREVEPEHGAEEATQILQDFLSVALKGYDGEPKANIAIDCVEGGWTCTLQVENEATGKRHGFQIPETPRFSSFIYECGKAIERLSKKFGTDFRFPDDVLPKKIIRSNLWTPGKRKK